MPLKVNKCRKNHIVIQEVVGGSNIMDRTAVLNI